MLSHEEIALWQPIQGKLWLHLDYSHPQAQQWIEHESGLDPLVIEVLLSEETRPRVAAIDDGILMALRAVNMNPGSEPDDMVSIRLWANENRMISSRQRMLLSVQDMLEQLKKNKGPADTGSLIIELVDRIVWRMSDTVEAYEDRIAVMEEGVLIGGEAAMRVELTQLRRQIISLNRYLAPQRDALARLLVEKAHWLDQQHRLQLREVNDRLIRHTENINVVRDRAAVVQEDLLSQLTEQSNNRMYMLSIIAAVFLPLGFLTGLLGINVGGIPGSDNPNAFLIFGVILVLIVALQLWLFRKKRWL